MPKPVLAPTALAVALTESDQIPFDDSPVLDLSRDGRQLVFVSDRDGTRRLMVRSLERVEARPLAGTERAFSPFFSPDAQWIGFFADGKLKKVPAAGGVALALADAPNTRGGVWLSDDSIVYAPDFTSGLMRVAAAGGRKPEVLTTPDAAGGERTHRWPTYLPGDASVLFTIGTLKNPGSYDDARIAVFDVKTRKIRVVLSSGSMARYVPSGHLLYVRSRVAHGRPVRRSAPRGCRRPGGAFGQSERRSFERSRLCRGRNGRGAGLRARRRHVSRRSPRPGGPLGKTQGPELSSTAVSLPPFLSRREASGRDDRSGPWPQRRGLGRRHCKGRSQAADLRRR